MNRIVEATEGMGIVEIIDGICLVLDGVRQWCQAQIANNAKFADKDAAIAELTKRLESIQGTDEFKAAHAARLAREEEKAKKTLASVEEEKKRLGIN